MSSSTTKIWKHNVSCIVLIYSVYFKTLGHILISYLVVCVLFTLKVFLHENFHTAPCYSVENQTHFVPLILSHKLRYIILKTCSHCENNVHWKQINSHCLHSHWMHINCNSLWMHFQSIHFHRGFEAGLKVNCIVTYSCVIDCMNKWVIRELIASKYNFIASLG